MEAAALATCPVTDIGRPSASAGSDSEDSDATDIVPSRLDALPPASSSIPTPRLGITDTEAAPGASTEADPLAEATPASTAEDEPLPSLPLAAAPAVPTTELTAAVLATAVATEVEPPAAAAPGTAYYNIGTGESLGVSTTPTLVLDDVHEGALHQGLTSSLMTTDSVATTGWEILHSVLGGPHEEQHEELQTTPVSPYPWLAPPYGLNPQP